MHLLDNDNEIQKWIGISLAAHLMLAAVLGWLNRPSREIREFYTPTYKVTLINPEKPVQRKEKKIVPAPKAAPARPLEKKAVKKEAHETGNIPPVPEKSKAIKKTARMATDPSAAIAALRKKQEAAMAVDRIRERLAEKEAAGGLPGEKSSKDSVEAERPKGVKKVSMEDMDRVMKKYYDSLWEKIQAAWVLPGPGRFEGLGSVLSVSIGRDGRLLSVSMEEGSGNGFYDQSALRAVEKAAPFEPLPEGYEGGLEVGFRFRL